MLDAVVAPGTDPELLARLVGALLADPKAVLRRFRAEVRAGHPLAGALRRALPADRATSLLTGPRGDVAGAAEQWARLGVTVALAGDPAYPGAITARGRTDAPLLLACRGAWPARRPAAAIVGSRRASAYGRGIAAWLGESLADAGVPILSGGALGVDAAAHGAAVDRLGGTVVVLGCGHAVGYPRPHAAPGGLFERVLAAGGSLLSECLPADAVNRYRVRDRNRIVAALSDAVVVVEGGARSGALVTAAEAADRDVPVLAVPGDIRAPGSAAPHRLLAEGAAVCTEPADVLALLGVASGVAGQPDLAAAGLPAAVERALAERWPRAIHVDDLAVLTGIQAGTLLAALTRARLARSVVQDSQGVRLARRPRTAGMPG